jgi:hypothetical protein
MSSRSSSRSSHSGSRGGGRPRINWSQYKDILYNLYLIDCQQLDNIIRYMQSQHNFTTRYLFITINYNLV